MSETLMSIDIPELPRFKSGKVREVFDLGDRLLMVATDRLSAFDCVLPTGIPRKGAVLNLLSAWWFGQTRHIIGNHMVTTDMSALPHGLGDSRPELRDRSMIVHKAEALPVECVARGYLIGSGWAEYKERGSVCGLPLREGYRMADRLDEAIFTPATKAETGHDENIPFERCAEIVGTGLAERLREVTLALYAFAAERALQAGIIIADTKFEFGLLDGELVLIDEALTPDSSRFWPAASWQAGQSPLSYDKQYVRDYLESIAWDKKPPAPPLPDDVAARTGDKYVQAYSELTSMRLR